MESTGILIVAGGCGRRAGGARPKQFQFLGGMPVLARTINTFEAALPGAEIVVVLPAEHIDFWNNLAARFDVAAHRVVAGGAERRESVRNGLAALTTDPALIAVQDGVRPLGSVGMIRRVAEAAALHGAAIPVVEPVDSIRMTDTEPDASGSIVSHPVDRRRLRIVQTPQVFRAEVLRRAFEKGYRAEFTDDASAVEAAGQPIFLTEGERENIKLTTPGDFLVAEALLAAREEAESEEEPTDAEHV